MRPASSCLLASAPLLKALPFQRIVQVLAALGFDDMDTSLVLLDDEVRKVVGDAAVRTAVLNAKRSGLAVLHERYNVGTRIKERCDLKLELRVPDNLVGKGISWESRRSAVRLFSCARCCVIV